MPCFRRGKRRGLSEMKQRQWRSLKRGSAPQSVRCCLGSWQQHFMTGWLTMRPPANRTLASRDIRNLP